jgi:hypothetical protein
MSLSDHRFPQRRPLEAPGVPGEYWRHGRGRRPWESAARDAKRLEQEINEFRADVLDWKDQSARLQPRWHTAAIVAPVFVLVLGVLAAVLASELLVGIASLALTFVTRLGLQARSNYHARRGSQLQSCWEEAGTIDASTGSDREDVKQGFAALKALQGRRRKLPSLPGEGWLRSGNATETGVADRRAATTAYGPG